MSAPKTCPACGDFGWVLYALETTCGELETDYRLCGCRSKGEGFPDTCGWGACEEAIPEGATLCGRHRAEHYAHASAEDWGMALDALDSFANAMHAGLGLPELDEAMEAAIEYAVAAKTFYEAEHERIRQADKGEGGG